MTNDDKSRHDFNNQLALIQGFAEILLDEAAPDDPRRPDFEEIRKAALNAVALLARMYPVRAEIRQ